MAQWMTLDEVTGATSRRSRRRARRQPGVGAGAPRPRSMRRARGAALPQARDDRTCLRAGQQAQRRDTAGSRLRAVHRTIGGNVHPARCLEEPDQRRLTAERAGESRVSAVAAETCIREDHAARVRARAAAVASLVGGGAGRRVRADPTRVRRRRQGRSTCGIRSVDRCRRARRSRAPRTARCSRRRTSGTAGSTTVPSRRTRRR